MSKKKVKVFVAPLHRPYRACFSIGVQSFYVCEREDKAEAEWYAEMLRKAFTAAGLEVI